MIWKNPKTLMPPRFQTTLRYEAEGNQLNAGVNYSNTRLQPTTPYDVDPTLGSTAMPGFTELAALYRRYRVNRWVHKVMFANNESFPVVVYLCPNNVDPGSNTASFQNFLSSRSSTKKMLSAKGGQDRGIVVSRFSQSSFAGVPKSRSDDNTAGNTSGSSAPNNNIWSVVGIHSVNVQVSGVFVSNQIDIEVEFYELTTPAT